MKFIILITLISSLLLGDETKNQRVDFLTQYEYGAKLYKNPRNMGCMNCHSNDGSGGVISHIKQNGKVIQITAPNIRNVTFEKLNNTLKSPKGFMPKYSLSESEIIALYTFLNTKQ